MIEGKCLFCGENTKPHKDSYRKFCSKSCSSKFTSKIRIEKAKLTNLRKYGVDNPGKLKKHVETNLKKYGVKSPGSRKEIQEKIKQTNLEKYGSEFYFSSETGKSKIQNTFIEKYGGPSPLCDNRITDKISKTNFEKYGSENVFSNREIIEKIKKTTSEKYEIHFNIKEYPIEELRRMYFDETLSLYEISEKINGVLCPNNIGQKLKQNGYDLRTSVVRSRQERKICNFLDDLKIQYVENDRSIYDENDKRKFYELDIFIPEYNIAIECNGVYHHDERTKHKNYHEIKRVKCAERNIHLLQFWDFEINNSIDKVQSIIKSHINKNEKIYARKCESMVISSKEASNFSELNHIQNHAKASVNLVLIHNKEIVSYMSFGKSRYDKTVQWELIRYCNKLHTNVIGGASKLFKYFIENYKPENIISYCDKRLFSGALYQNLGFQKTHDSPPNYFYYVNGKAESRIKYQKHKLINILPNYEFKKTEYQNMNDHGYYRIFDCGQSVWMWKRGD